MLPFSSISPDLLTAKSAASCSLNMAKPNPLEQPVPLSFGRSKLSTLPNFKRNFLN